MNELTTTEVKQGLTATVKVAMSPNGLREAADIIEKQFNDFRVSSVYYSSSYGGRCILELYLNKDTTKDIDVTSSQT